MRPKSSGAKEKVVGPLFPCPLAMPVVLLSDARGRDQYEYATYIQYIHNIVPTEGHHQFYRGFTNPPCNEAYASFPI